MLQEALDFQEESELLFRLLEPLGDNIFGVKTLFKDWTPNDIITHLYTWNWTASTALNNETEFQKIVGPAAAAVMKGEVRQFEKMLYAHLTQRDLLNAWREQYLAMADCFVSVDPKYRVKWAGPDLSVRSSITARLMEIWAHGQAIYDLLGEERKNTDRIKSICMLGINTFGWTFRVHHQEVPENVPYLRLTAPSGKVWEWNEPNEESYVSGLAEEFCQVVTQTRNIADTSLTTVGETASRWMHIAQCFAGPAELPPMPKKRHRHLGNRS